MQRGFRMRDLTGAELAARLAEAPMPTLALEGEIRARTGLWFDNDIRKWRGTNGAVLSPDQVANLVKASKR